MRTLLYGAGQNCSACINEIKDSYSIIAIVDRDEKKRNSLISGIPVISLNEMKKEKFDSIIITISGYASAVDELLRHNILIENICRFDLINKKVIPLKQEYDDSVEKRIYREQAIIQVKRGLLFEAYNSAEFEGKDIISVIGDKKDYDIISDFFEKVSLEISVLHNDFRAECDGEKIKYILCDTRYKENLKTIREIRNKNYRNWIVLPFYDVEYSLDWKLGV